MQSVTIGGLKTVIELSDLPDEHLQWLIDHSEHKEYNDGDIIGKYGQEAKVMWISWVGKVTFYMYLVIASFSSQPEASSVTGYNPFVSKLNAGRELVRKMAK